MSSVAKTFAKRSPSKSVLIRVLCGKTKPKAPKKIHANPQNPWQVPYICTMNENTTNRRKEGLILAIVAIIGISGLVLLQMARRSKSGNADQKTVIQNQDQAGNNPNGQAQSNIQQVPVNLLRVNEQPEMNKPFIYELADYSQGGVYQLDPGDGSPRQSFTAGKLSYTYRRPGAFQVSIYALDGASEYKMLTVKKEVANLTVPQAVNKKTGKPLIDD